MKTGFLQDFFLYIIFRIFGTTLYYTCICTCGIKGSNKKNIFSKKSMSFTFLIELTELIEFGVGATCTIFPQNHCYFHFFFFFNFALNEGYNIVKDKNADVSIF